MNESQLLADGGRFDPPSVGMLSGESIVWTRRAGTGFWIIFIGFIVLAGGPAFTLVSFEYFGLFLAVIVGILTLIGYIMLLGTLINVRRTRYYLTTDRILEVRGGKIKRYFSLEHFAGRPLGQFLESRATHSSGNESFYAIRIYNPVTDEVMEFTGLDPNSTRAFQRIGERVECPYCGFNNPAIRSQCKNCDAVM
jgi:hypothetical protein